MHKSKYDIIHNIEYHKLIL